MPKQPLLVGNPVLVVVDIQEGGAMTADEAERCRRPPLKRAGYGIALSPAGSAFRILRLRRSHRRLALSGCTYTSCFRANEFTKVRPKQLPPAPRCAMPEPAT